MKCVGLMIGSLTCGSFTLPVGVAWGVLQSKRTQFDLSLHAEAKEIPELCASCCLTCVKCAEWCMATPHGSGLSDSELVNECSLTLCPGSSGRFEHFKTNHIPIQLIRILHYASGKLSRCLVRFQHQSYLLSFTTLMLWYKTQTLIRCFLGWLLANKAAVQSNKSELQFGWNLRILIGCYRALISRYPSQCDAPVQSPTLLALEQIWSLLAKMRPKPAGHISFVHHLSTVYVMAGGGL